MTDFDPPDVYTERPTFPGSRTRHGTNSGWRLHNDRGERPCDPCYRAKEEYDARRRETPQVQQTARANARAQGRATTRLRAMYPEDWARLYAEEKARGGPS